MPLNEGKNKIGKHEKTIRSTSVTRRYSMEITLKCYNLVLFAAFAFQLYLFECRISALSISERKKWNESACYVNADVSRMYQRWIFVALKRIFFELMKNEPLKWSEHICGPLLNECRMRCLLLSMHWIHWHSKLMSTEKEMRKESTMNPLTYEKERKIIICAHKTHFIFIRCFRCRCSRRHWKSARRRLRMKREKKPETTK